MISKYLISKWMTQIRSILLMIWNIPFCKIFLHWKFQKREELLIRMKLSVKILESVGTSEHESIAELNV